MKNINQNFTLTALVSAMTAISSNVIAEDDPVVELISPDSNISVGVGYMSGEREQLGIYDDLTDDETVLLLDADVVQRDDATGTWSTVKARNLGIDNRSIELNYERQGDWGIRFDYSKIPHISPYSVNSSITGLGTETQTVPVTGATGANIKLGTERESIGLKYLKHLSPTFNFNVSFKTEDKEGNRHWGYRTNSGSQVNFLAEPIDSTTRQLDARLNYAGKQLQLSGGYNLSTYDNHKSLVTAIDNGAGTTDYLSLPLDNQAHQLYLNGGYNFTRTTRGTFRVSYTHATQNEYLPTANISGLANASAPSNINGEMDTTVVVLGLSARPIDKLNLVANLRYHEVDDKTPAALVVPGEPVHIKPNGYKTISGKLEGVYRLPDDYKFIAGIDLRNQDRTRPLNLGDEHIVPARTELDETTYRVQLRKSLSENLTGSLAFLYSKRDGSSYEAADNVEENILNPINIADRERDKWRLNLEWIATEKIGLQFNYEHSNDDYGPDSNPNGLVDGSAELFSLDADYAINQKWHLSAWISKDETKASEYVTDYGASAAVIEWQRYSQLKDTGTSLGLGLRGQASSKIKFGADMEWSRSKSEYHDNNDPAITGTNIPLPDIESTTQKLSLFTEYALAKNTDLRFDIIYQRWETNDWTWTFSDGTAFTYGTTSDGTTVTTDFDQSSTFVGVSYKYKF